MVQKANSVVRMCQSFLRYAVNELSLCSQTAPSFGSWLKIAIEEEIKKKSPLSQNRRDVSKKDDKDCVKMSPDSRARESGLVLSRSFFRKSPIFLGE